MLVQRGVLPPPKLREALEFQRGSGNRLATECCLRGFASEADLLGPLSAQVGVPGAHMGRLLLPLRFLDIVPEQVAHKQLILPVRVEGERVFLAMADPGDNALISEVAFTSSKHVLPCVALHGLLRRAIEQAYRAKRNGELEYRGEHADSAEVTVESAMAFIVAEELSQVPAELISSVAPPGKQPPAVAEGPVALGESLTSEIVIETERAERSSADLEIPVQDADVEELQAPADGELRRRVLVVDDDPDLRRLVVRLLRSKGLEVEEAARGLEALAAIKRAPPDLILLDAMLPEVHGFDICRKIKSSDRYGGIPVIMISSVYRGWRFAQDLKDTYGVDAFLEKPFELTTLWSAVERTLAGAKRQPRSPRQLSAAAKKAIREGVKRFKSGDLDGAIDSYREGIRIDPLSAKLHHQLAILYLKKKGMTYQAMQEFEEAVALDADHFSALRNLAILYQSKGFKNKAIEMWERALRASPDAKTGENIRRHLMTLINRAVT